MNSMFKAYFLYLYCLSLPVVLVCQEEAKYGFELKTYLEQVEENHLIPLLIEGNEALIPELVESVNGTIRLKINNLFSIEIPAKQVKEFSNNPAVEKIEFSLEHGKALSDTMLIQVNADSVHRAIRPLIKAYSGKGVILGVIDSGIEIDHPDFKDSTGNTRIMYIWDQGVPYNSNLQANQYTYGVEWNESQINNGIATHDDNPAEFGHGSNVTGAAASNGLATGNFKGVAPDVKIISVATDFRKPNWLQTVAEAVDYIYAKADSLGLPCVINASIGTYVGSHDGKDIAARMIDAMIQQKSGRSFVCAAGNAATIPFHLQHELQSDTAFTWFVSNSNQWSGLGGLFFTLWSDTADFSHLQFSIGADKILSNNTYQFRGRTAFDSIQNRLNFLYTDSIIGANSNRIATINTYAEESQGRYKLEVAIIQPDSANYRFRLESRGTGKFDLWSSWNLFRHSDMIAQNLPSTSLFPEMRKYQMPDNNQTIVSSFTCLPSVITVGNYTNRNTYIDVSGTPRSVNYTPGQISVNSSLGPTRLGILKPDLSSAGDFMFAAGRLATIQAAISTNPDKVSQDSLHFRNGGTSMASPTVAGMVALYLEQCNEATHSQIQADFFQSVKSDQFTNNLPNNKWGRGKADAYQFLLRNNYKATFSSPSPPHCLGDTITLMNTNPSWSFTWNTEATSNSIQVANNGNYFALVEDAFGCKSFTDTLSVLFNPLPTQPIVQVSGNQLSIQVNGNYQWYFNNQAINNAIDSFHVAQYSGDYYCNYTDSLGCSINSDTVNVLITGIEKLSTSSFKIFPNPVKEKLYIYNRKDVAIFSVSLFTSGGKLIFENQKLPNEQQIEIAVGYLTKGMYFLKVATEKDIHTFKIIVN